MAEKVIKVRKLEANTILGIPKIVLVESGIEIGDYVMVSNVGKGEILVRLHRKGEVKDEYSD